MQKANSKEPLELHKEADTQVLLSKFLSGEIKTLEPVYDQQLGYRYPQVEAIVGDASQVALFLNKLSRTGVLEKKLYDKTEENLAYCRQNQRFLWETDLGEHGSVCVQYLKWGVEGIHK